MYSHAVLDEVRRNASALTSRQFRLPGGASLRGGVADGEDGEAVKRLAALSRRPAPRGAVLLAVLDGDPVAAIGIFDGNVVADHTRSSLHMRTRLRLERLLVRAVVSVRGI